MIIPTDCLVAGHFAYPARQALVLTLRPRLFPVCQQADWQFRLSRLVVLAALVLLILGGIPLVGPHYGPSTLPGHEPSRRSIHRFVSMFRCQLCQRVVPPRTPCQRLVLKWRNKVYPHRSRANVVVRQRTANKQPKKEYRDDPGGEGQEIVQEVTVCPDCAARNGQT